MSQNGPGILPERMREFLSDDVQDFSFERMHELNKLMSYYRCAMMEVVTKFNVLNEQFSLQFDRNPITGSKSRLKTLPSILEKLERLIKEFSLEKVRKNTGDRLSGGERRRTEIARCLAIEPKFIMLDEPFAGVDPIAVEDIQQIVWQLKYRNIGILITDHNVHETLNITDRAYLLFEGRILFKGSPEELAVNPIVKEKYLGSNFVLQKKDFAKMEEMRRRKWTEEES